jgi:3-oxoacyl-[acyl-carrier protein] reductase
MDTYKSELSLKDKNILITGVSRPMGIGAAITKTLARAGANVVIHGFSKYDEELKYTDSSSSFSEQLARDLHAEGYKVTALPSFDLSEKNAPEKLVSKAAEISGYIDGLVLNHAYSVCLPIGEWTQEHIDAHLNINVRASMLIIQAFAAQLPKGKKGSVTLFTSGQFLGPMIKEMAYAVSKEAIVCICKQAAVALAPKSIRVNCINPGPTDTGYMKPGDDDYKKVAGMFPAGRWGLPEDAARLVHFLQSNYSSWITGQVISSEGGYRRDVIV